MKSPEQFGAPINESKIESAEDKAKAAKQKERDEYIKQQTEWFKSTEQYDALYAFNKQMGIGTPEELKAIGDRAYQYALKKDMFNTAMKLAEELYGKDSEEWQRAYQVMDGVRQKMQEAQKSRDVKKTKEHPEDGREIRVLLSKDATFADLFAAIDALEKKEGEGVVHLDDELADNFDEKIAEEILAFRGIDNNKAASTKVIDFFKAHGLPQSDIITLLPIKFKRAQKIKK
jgi:hypothetical protein